MSNRKVVPGVIRLPTRKVEEKAFDSFILAATEVGKRRAAELASVGLPTRPPKSWLVTAEKMLKESSTTMSSPAAMTAANKRNKK